MAAQVLPGAQSHFGPFPSMFNTDMFSEYQSYPNMQTESFAGFPSGLRSNQGYFVSPRSTAAGETHRRPSSQSPTAVMRQPPSRNRTPIQHHRDSTSRARSHSRSELLLAYATEQGQVSVPPVQASMMVVPSQSAPTTPQVFPMPSYNLPHETTENYTDPSGYFPASIPPSTSQLPDFTYQQSDPHFGGYFPVGRSASQSDAGGVSSLNPHETMYDPTQGQNIGHPGTSISGQGHDFPPVHGMLESTPSDLEITLSRPKPQCWEHGCNGRQFSTFSNLLRHQREKSGSAMKALCPYCGTEFTRTTARNGHMYGGKCKGRPDKEPSEEFPSASGKEK